MISATWQGQRNPKVRPAYDPTHTVPCRICSDRLTVTLTQYDSAVCLSHILRREPRRRRKTQCYSEQKRQRHIEYMRAQREASKHRCAAPGCNVMVCRRSARCQTHANLASGLSRRSQKGRKHATATS